MRVGVQDDVFAAARAGIIPTSVYLSLLPHYQNETEYYVWSSIISNLSLLESLYPIFHVFEYYLVFDWERYSSTSFAPAFRNYVSKLLRPLAQVRLFFHLLVKIYTVTKFQIEIRMGIPKHRRSEYRNNEKCSDLIVGPVWRQWNFERGWCSFQTCFHWWRWKGCCRWLESHRIQNCMLFKKIKFNLFC